MSDNGPTNRTYGKRPEVMELKPAKVGKANDGERYFVITGHWYNT